MLKVIYVARINKSAEVLAAVSRRSVTSQGEITSRPELLNLFTGTRANPKRRIIDTTALLAKQGFLSVGQIDHEVIYKITPRGRQHLEKYRHLRLDIPVEDPWQGRWYLVSFQIPDRRRAVRNSVIIQLKKLGFISYIKGLWVYPYDPAAAIETLRKRHQLADDQLVLITTSDLTGQRRLRQHFKLSL